MAAAVGTAFNWVFVRSGIWTKIFQGPLVSGIPFQALELASTSGTGTTTAAPMVTWTLDGFSASPPFYQRSTGTSIASGVSSPPVGHIGTYAAVLSFRISPWVEFNLLTNRNCWAHIALL